MPKPKIDRVKLNQMLRAGKPQKEIAQKFGVSEGAISKAKQELRISVVKNLALESAHRVVDKSLNAVDQLQNINSTANELLETAMSIIRGEKPPVKMKGDPRDVALKAMQEIRNQLRLQLDIFQSLYDMKAVQEFQHEVLSAIEEVSPDVRNRIVNRLSQRRAIRSAIKFD